MIFIDHKPIGMAPIHWVLSRGTDITVISARFGARTMIQEVIPDRDRDLDFVFPIVQCAGRGGAPQFDRQRQR